MKLLGLGGIQGWQGLQGLWMCEVWALGFGLLAEGSGPRACHVLYLRGLHLSGLQARFGMGSPDEHLLQPLK